MKLPDELQRWLARRYASQHRGWLAAAGADTAWPLTIALGMPTEAAAMRQPEAVRAWADSWRAWNGHGTLVWAERRWKVLGTQRLPSSLTLHNAGQAAAWIGEEERWQRASQRYAALVADWPALATVLPRLFDTLADYGDTDFQRLRQLLAWLARHPASGLYPRQLPLPGIDSKWLEPRKGVVAVLVAALRGVSADLDSTADDRDFYTLCGLKRPPATARMRVLDPALRAAVGGLSDISAPLSDLTRLSWQPSNVIIVENLQTGLALDDLPGTVAFMALGYAAETLAVLPWVRNAACLYWGDIDTHGYAILHRARSGLPHLASVMMDEATMRRFTALWTEERSPLAADDLLALTPAERIVYLALRQNSWGQALRLEQERISWDFAWPTLRMAIGATHGAQESE